MKIRCAVDNYDREMSTYIVAYVDILGVASKMQQNTETQNQSLNLLHNLFTQIIELSDGERGIKKYENIKIRIFSDNIIFAHKLSDNAVKRKDEIAILLNCVSNFACSAAGDHVGWLVRGGITIGEFYINDTIIWGPALLRAYELEDKIAIYPRIVIDSTIILELTKNKKVLEFISKDFDGAHYLNYMNIWHFAGESVKGGFEIIKSNALKLDGTYPDRIYQKLFWHMNYINRELDKKNERKDKKYRLSL